ncbi:kinase-like domain-containing protein [Xylaria bambusicola]|uniref:kinase-like domain-containing protein n=1 Tax=Xylaria bambusicola TaxID=326684 RepID=UPI00200889A2|nr:kinase-like domain-containing protein [Xylaria bambusicola]KAI0505639.1 kinase-like domain-containing protein [Xylaria bambusicola]
MSHNHGVPDAERIREFIREVETRRRSHNLYSPDIDHLKLEFQEDTASHHESDGVSRVGDYGFQAWARNAQKLKPSPDSGDFIGFENLDQKPATILQDDLRNTLEEAMLPALPNDAQTYLPLGQVEAICRRDVVRRELVRTFGDDNPDIDRLIDYVCGSQDDSSRDENTSRKIFANLVLIRKLDKIKDFMDTGIKDRHLPFRKFSHERMSEPFALVKRATLNREKSEPVFCFDNWSLVEQREFYDNQWRLLSPYFDRAPDGTVGLYELDEQCIMPWIKKGEEKRGTFVPAANIGGFAKVTKFFIHPDHHAFDTNKVAIKELIELDDTPFHQEFKNLKRVQTRDHLLPVYAAYRRGNFYSFIFPWADGGSLNDLWARDPLELKERVRLDTHEGRDVLQTKKIITWVACQLSGLTGRLGLGFLHDTQFLEPAQPTLVVPNEKEKRYGIHGDIKPGNILYFEQDQNGDGSGLGLFKISDFGITGFHSALTRSRQPPTGPHSPTYRAPEFGVLAAYLSRKYDIWSLGCVLLQFLTWLMSGPNGLRQFDEARLNEMDQNNLNFKEDKFFMTTQNGEAGHKVSVQEHIGKLQSKITKGNYLHDCLALIRDRMLRIDVANRANCNEIHECLASYYKKCLQDKNYAIDILPSLQEPASSAPIRSQVPGILVTSHSANAPSEVSDDTAEADQVSDISTATAGNRVSTIDSSPMARHEQITFQANTSVPHQHALNFESNNTKTEEKQKTSKTKRLLSYLRFNRLRDWSIRRRSSSQSST